MAESTVLGVRTQPRAKYLALVLISIQRAITYRRTLLINIISNLVWVVIAYYVWQAVFAETAQIGSFEWPRMRTYLIVAYAVNSLLYSSSSVYRMMSIIYTGDIATELIRPFDFLKAQLAQAAGSAVVEGLFGSVIAVILGVLVGGALPASPLLGLIFLVSVVLGYVIKFLTHFIVALLCFWTINWLGLYWAETAIVGIFSGSLVPLTFLPGWLRAVAYSLPFQGIVHIPLALYLGDLTGSAVWFALATQGAWIVGLWLFIRLIWQPSLRALEIQRG